MFGFRYLERLFASSTSVITLQSLEALNSRWHKNAHFAVSNISIFFFFQISLCINGEHRENVISICMISKLRIGFFNQPILTRNFLFLAWAFKYHRIYMCKEPAILFYAAHSSVIKDCYCYRCYESLSVTRARLISWTI